MNCMRIARGAASGVEDHSFKMQSRSHFVHFLLAFRLMLIHKRWLEPTRIVSRVKGPEDIAEDAGVSIDVSQHPSHVKPVLRRIERRIDHPIPKKPGHFGRDY